MEKNQLTDKQLNEKESIELITRMIQNTQNRLERNAGLPFLAWGYATVLVTVLVAVMLYRTQNPLWNFLWFIIPVIGVPFIIFRRKQPKGVRTYVDDVVSYIWTVLGIVGFGISFIAILPVFWFLKFPILFVVTLVMGIGTTLTGLVIKFKPCVFGGALGLAISLLLLAVRSGIWTLVLFALAFIIMMVIPGHILNHKARLENV